MHDFQTPDVEAPRNATAVTFGRKAAGVKTPSPSHVSISVLNGNGVDGAATNAAYELGQRGYRIVVPANAADRNAPSFDYFHTKVYYDRKQAGARPAARKVADLFGDGEVGAAAGEARARKAQRAMLTVVVGSTFHGTIAPAPADKTPKKQPRSSAPTRARPSRCSGSVAQEACRSGSWCRRCSSAPPTSTARSPIRTYKLTKGERAVRLTFLSSHELAAYWGIEETTWQDAPALQQPNFRHVDRRPRVLLLLQRRASPHGRPEDAQGAATGS